MAAKPLIGITMRLELPTDRFYLGRHYSEALEACGGIPIHIPLIPDAGYISDIVERLDGVLLPGSDSDCDPHMYGEEPMPRLGRVVPERDLTDSLVLRFCEERNLPILAICYGIQALNVSRGGTLIQDIGSQIEDCIRHEQGQPAEPASHGLRIEPRSKLAKLAGGTESRVNSHHHQAIKTLGRDLSATAWAPDGIIECVEDVREERWVLGVQWHPELSWHDDSVSRALFVAFVGRCSSKG